MAPQRVKGEAERAKMVPLDQLRRFPGNAKRGDVETIADSLERNEQYRPIVVNIAKGGKLGEHRGSFTILAGNHTFDAAKRLGWKRIRCWMVEADDARARRINLIDNRAPELGGTDRQALADLLEEARDDGGLEGTGYEAEDLDDLLADAEGQAEAPAPAAPSLADRFLVPPFTVLDARAGYWRDRERDWMKLGIRSEIGRGENLLGFSETVLSGGDPKGRKARAIKGHAPTAERGLAKALLGSDASIEKAMGERYAARTTGTSIFSPTLCEVAYRWWSPPRGRVLDPFAGGSVRGIVAGFLGRRYIGCELRPEQIEANEDQAREIISRPSRKRPRPEWIERDAEAMLDKPRVGGGDPFDFVFSCPPYFDLETYSDDPRDLSNLATDEFLRAYRAIIGQAVELLDRDRFACFVVGDAREGHRQRSLVSETIAAFEDAGAISYNHAILITPGGSAAIRAGRQFESGRKLVRTHQHVLVFCKGDPIEATKACGTVKIDDALKAAAERSNEAAEDEPPAAPVSD
jgi:hypothetical protein